MIGNLLWFVFGFFVCAYAYNNSSVRTGVNRMLAKLLMWITKKRNKVETPTVIVIEKHTKN